MRTLPITDLNEEREAVKTYCEERLSMVLGRAVTIDILPASSEAQVAFQKREDAELKRWMKQQTETLEAPINVSPARRVIYQDLSEIDREFEVGDGLRNRKLNSDEERNMVLSTADEGKKLISREE